MKSRMRAIGALLTFSIVLSGCAAGMPFARSEPITLRYVYQGATPEIEALLAEYHELYPDVTVELLGPDTEDGALTQGVLNGNIDLIRSGAEALGYADRGLLLPLDDLQLDDWADVREDYFGGLWESLSVAGEQYGIPAGLDTVVTFVNMQALEALDETLPAPDVPWDNYAFLDLATRLNHPEGLPGDPSQSVYGFCSDHQQLDPFIFVYANGGSIVDNLQDPQRPHAGRSRDRRVAGVVRGSVRTVRGCSGTRVHGSELWRSGPARRTGRRPLRAVGGHVQRARLHRRQSLDSTTGRCCRYPGRRPIWASLL